MRIGFNFHTSDEYISGVENYSLGLLGGLLTIDSCNEYIVFTNKPDLVESRIGKYPNLTIINLNRLRTRLHRIAWEQFRLNKSATRHGIDVMHCPHYICPAISQNIPYIITIHDTIAIDHPRWCKKSNALYYKLAMKPAVKTAVKIITVSDFAKKSIERNFPTACNKIKTIYPGIDTIFNTSNNPHQQKYIKKKYGLSDKYIVYSGNIEPKKNILNLLKAFRALQEKSFEHKLVITGNRSWKSKEIWDYIRRFFTNDQVQFTGYIKREDLDYVYKGSRCLLSLSHCEGLGFPAIEALSCGVPVAATKCGILKEISPKAFTELNPHDIDRIASAVELILTSTRLRYEQIRTGLSEAKKFCWQKCATQTLDVYTEAAKNHG